MQGDMWGPKPRLHLAWTPEAERLLEQLVVYVSPQFRAEAEEMARAEAEEYARVHGRTAVDRDEMLIGYIRSTPSHIQKGLRARLRVLGIDVERFEAHFRGPASHQP